MDNTLIQYYRNEMALVGGASKIKITSEISNTKWMDITPELATVLIEILQKDLDLYHKERAKHFTELY